MENRERLRDLPVFVLQSALNGVGQALLLGDKIKSTIRRAAGGEAPDGERPAAGDVRDEQAAGERTERREPVIFAPRPSKAEQADAVTTEKATTEKATAEKTVEKRAEKRAERPAAETGPSPAAPAQAEPAEAKPAEAKGVEPEAPAEAKPAEAEAPAAAGNATSTATGNAPEADAEATTEATTGPAQAAEQVSTENAAAPEKAATPEKAADTAAPGVEQAEPMPGYANLSLPSLRARLRGKSAEQVHALLDYEKEHLNRPEVVRLFQNRLSKLQSES